MRIKKETGVSQGMVLDGQELALINQLSRKELKQEDVYAFGVRLCDNEVDRDGERFPAETLRELAELFVGKSGIFDHQWSAAGQTARIYRTELVQEENIITAAGETYCYLKGYAYMLRNEKNRDLIDEIEGGIKKEVSVGCAVERAVCSICGEEINDKTRCSHVKGQKYDGTLCWADLIGATDAYEWSFVAVPAQKNAGVIKALGGNTDRAVLEREAAAGRKYLKMLREDVTRLGRLAQPELGDVMKRITDKLDEEELSILRQTYQKRLDERFPLQTQMRYGDAERARKAEEQDTVFLI